jgi:NTP pyrophosphatase (non-canonical NTP hydrolase)
MEAKYHKALEEVSQELERLSKLVNDPTHPFDDLQSVHQGYALLLEELDELWEEIRKKNKLRDNEAMREEAKQISALAIRFMTDLT